MPLITLTACELPKPQQGLKNSTFTVDAIDGTMIHEELGDLGLPQNRTYQLNACLKDTKTQQSLVNQTFEIKGGPKAITAVSDEKGCLHWSEKMSFNFLSNSNYLLFKRDLVSKSKNSGTSTLELAVNPWLEGKDSKVFDLSKNKVEPLIINQDQVIKTLQAVDIKTGKKIKKNLWAENGRLFVLDEQFIKDKGVQLTFDVRLNPTLILNKINGEKYFQALTEGNLKVRIFLYNTTMSGGKSERTLLSTTPEFKTYSIKNNQISIKEQLLITSVPKRGQLLLAVHLKTDEGNLSELKDQILDFKGIFPLGEYDTLKNTAFLKVASEITEGHQDANIELNFENDKISTTHNLQKAKYEVSPIESKFLKVLTDTSQSRKISYNVKFCMINGIDHKPLRGEEVKVSSGSTEQSHQLDINACVSVDDTIVFEPFSCQHYIKKDFKLSSSVLGLDDTYSILINPWEATSSGAFRDLRYATNEEVNQIQCSKDKNINSQLQIDNFHFTQNSLNYHFDKNLSLEVIKNIFIKMEPKVIIPSSFSNGTSEISALRNGAYRVRIAIIKNQKNILDSYITHTEKFVNVVDGKINSTFDLGLSELKQLGIRNNVLIDIAPLKSDLIEVHNSGQITALSHIHDLKSIVDIKSPLANNLFIGPIILNNDQSSTPLMPLNNSNLANFISTGKISIEKNEALTLDRIIERGLLLKEDHKKQIEKISDRNYFANLNNLEVVSVKNPEYSPDFFKNWKPDALVKKVLRTADDNKDPVLEDVQVEVNKIIDSSQITFQQRQTLCLIWTNHLLKKFKADKGGALSSTMQDSFKILCAQNQTKNPFFITEKRFFVYETGATELIDGRNFNINTGTNFAVSRTHTTSTTRTSSASLSAKVPEVVTQFLPLNASLNYSISSATQDSDSEAFSTNFGSNLSLVVQQNLFNIELKSYEQCLIVRINPIYLTERKLGPFSFTSSLVKWMNPRLSEDDKKLAATRGLLLCKGQVENKKISRKESQFVIFQDIKSTEIQDSGNEKLRSFYIALRGDNDYARFINAIKAQSSLPTDQVLELKADEQASVMNKLSKLTHQSPTHPGVYAEPAR